MGVFRENCLDIIGAEPGKVNLAESVFHMEEVATGSRRSAGAMGEVACGAGDEEWGVVGGRVR